jgi:hypothetical protein
MTPPTLSPALKLPATILGVALLIGGTFWSLARLDIGWSEVRLLPLVANLVLAQSALLAIAAITLRLSAKAVGTEIGFREALRFVAFATFAEILPLPGGALVRGAALMRSGASLGGATSIVTLTAILSLALLVAMSAAALIGLGTPEALPVLGLALVGLLASFAVIARRAGFALSLAILAIRLFTAAAGAVSIYLALVTLAQPAGILEAALLTVSATLGSAVMVIPAGIGISEGIAAGLATLTNVAPEAAFLAVAIHRALGLLASLMVVLWPTPRA